MRSWTSGAFSTPAETYHQRWSTRSIRDSSFTDAPATVAAHFRTQNHALGRAIPRTYRPKFRVT
jgi:hypothetical protein